MTERRDWRKKIGAWAAAAVAAVGALLALDTFWPGSLGWLGDRILGVVGVALLAGGVMAYRRLRDGRPGDDRPPPPAPPATPGEGGPGPGARPVGAPGIILSAGLLVAFAFLILYSLYALWPGQTPYGLDVEGMPVMSLTADTAMAGAEPMAADSLRALRSQLAAGYRRLPCDTTGVRVGRLILPDSILDPDCERLPFTGAFIISFEQRLLLIVILAGALGGLIHSLRSLSWYTGNRELRRSWLLTYLALPFVGAAIALVFYLAVKGGFFVNGGSPGDANPFGFAALAAIVGMFSTQAVLKLKQVAETVFATPIKGADARPQEADGDGRDAGGGGDGGGSGGPGRSAGGAAGGS